MSAMPVKQDLPQLLSAEVAADPYAFYRRLRAEEPLRYDRSTESYLVTRHAAVHDSYRNPVFSSRNYEWQLEPVFGRSLLQLEGSEHSRKRALVSPYFRGKGLEKWMPVIHRNVGRILDGLVERNADELAGRLTPGAEVDLLAEFAHFLPVYVIADMLALPKADYQVFCGWYTAMINFLSNLSKDPVVHAAGIAAAAELREYLTPIIAERRSNPGEDLISALVTAEIEGERLEDEEIKTHVTQLLNAGSETTDKTVGSLFRHLLTNRELYEAVRDDRSLLTAAISETLRVTPPSQMNGRVVTEDVEIEGQTVPANSFVMLIMASANRDERRFEAPETYNPYRTDLQHDKAFTAVGEHFAFGFGRHFCLGAMLAKAELEVGTSALMDRFPEMRLADGFVPTEHGLKMRAPMEMRVVL
jgi:cytochrome P450